MLRTYGEEAFHGREGHAAKALVPLHALEVRLRLIGHGVAYDVVAARVDDALIIEEVEVVADSRIQAKHVLELDLLGGLDRRDHY